MNKGSDFRSTIARSCDLSIIFTLTQIQNKIFKMKRREQDNVFGKDTNDVLHVKITVKTSLEIIFAPTEKSFVLVIRPSLGKILYNIFLCNKWFFK